MTTFRTITGRFEIKDFGPEHVNVFDIATGLAKANRYNGQYSGDHPVSVAQHSVLISIMMEEELRDSVPSSPCFHLKLSMVGLLHDASEAYLGDCPKPFKPYLPDFVALENKFQTACYIKLYGRDITEDEHCFLKGYDQRMLDMECRELKRPTCFNIAPDERIDQIQPHHWWDIAEAKATFMDRYNFLADGIDKAGKERAA